MKHLFKFSLCALALTMGANTGFAQSGETGLKDAYKDYFSIGVAVNMRNISILNRLPLLKKTAIFLFVQYVLLWEVLMNAREEYYKSASHVLLKDL